MQRLMVVTHAASLCRCNAVDNARNWNAPTPYPRELAGLLRVAPKALFKALGGYQEKKMHRVVLSGAPYAFPKLGNVIVPFQVTRAIVPVALPMRLCAFVPCRVPR